MLQHKSPGWRQIIVTTLREILTVRDVALELRCSVAHVYNVINGKVKNVSRLPVIRIGRRRLVQRDTLEEWKRSNEQGDLDGMISSSKINAVRRIEEDLYA
jgi:excisionase family DNA binding protein